MLTFQMATLADLETIRLLANSIFPQTYADILTPKQSEYMMEMMYSISNLKKQMTEEKQIFYLVIYDNNPCGYFSLQPAENKKVILQKLYLLPSLQGKGIGRKMMDNVIRCASVHFKEYRFMQLYVNRMNRAKDFYLKYGFRITAQRDHAIGNDFYMNDYIMEMPLP